MKRLGRNINGYAGEGIEIAAVLNECTTAARTHGWAMEEICPGSTPVIAFARPALATVRPVPLAPAQASPDTTVRSSGNRHRSTSPGNRPRVYLSTGIHGDEPAGPLAVSQLLHENRWPAGVDIWVCPCLNPTGFALGRRENGEGIDLNRDFLEPKASETIAHVAWLNRQPNFDLCLCLHEDWESHGFYVYELNPDERPSLAEAMVARVAQVCPIDHSEIIEGRPAQKGIIRPNLDPHSRPQWPEAFFLLTRKTRLSYTLEAPSDFPLSTRLAALVAGVRAALEALTKPGSQPTAD